MERTLVGILMGSDSGLSGMKKAAEAVVMVTPLAGLIGDR